MISGLGRVRCQPLDAAPGCRLRSSITGRAGRCSQRRHSTGCRRLCAGEIRSSRDPDSSSESKAWPRHAESDASKSTDMLDVSWEESDASASIDEAQLAKNRETFLLRLASLGFGAVLVGERLTGRGVVQALGHPTGIPLYEMDAGLGVLVGALLIGGIAPTKWIYRSVTDDARSVLDDVPALLGRLSCIGLATTIATEVYTGKGVLSLLNFETGTETLTEVEFAVTFLVLLVITNLKSGPAEDSD